MRLVISILGLCVHFQIGDIEICNGRIDFKFVLKQCSYILVCGKNTFGAIADHQKGVNIFPEFFCNVCRGASAHLYGDGDIVKGGFRHAEGLYLKYMVNYMRMVSEKGR